MSDRRSDRRVQSYTKLKQLFHTFKDTLNPHLDVLALADLGVEIFLVDLSEETARGGPYYLPMSQSCLQALDERPEFSLTFSWNDDRWNDPDAYTLARAFSEQMTESREGTLFRAYEKTRWSYKGFVMNVIRSREYSLMSFLV